jgi:hypothetical protein
MRRKLPPVYLLNMHTLSFSLHSCNLLPSAYKRKSWGSLRKGALAFDFLLSLLSRGALPFFFYLQPTMALTLQRLGKSSLSHSFVPPYYKSAQVIQQHELDVGFYFPEARTSINHAYPHLRNRPRPDMQSEKFTVRENPDRLYVAITSEDRSDVPKRKKYKF